VGGVGGGGGVLGGLGGLGGFGACGSPARPSSPPPPPAGPGPPPHVPIKKTSRHCAPGKSSSKENLLKARLDRMVFTEERSPSPDRARRADLPVPRSKKSAPVCRETTTVFEMGKERGENRRQKWKRRCGSLRLGTGKGERAGRSGLTSVKGKKKKRVSARTGGENILTGETTRKILSVTSLARNRKRGGGRHIPTPQEASALWKKHGIKREGRRHADDRKMRPSCLRRRRKGKTGRFRAMDQKPEEALSINERKRRCGPPAHVEKVNSSDRRQGSRPHK